jgi:hypothetical protein
VTRFSDEVAAAIALAREHAEEQAAVGPEHLLGALPLAAPGVVEAALGVPGGDWVRERLAATLPVEALPRIGERPLTASAAAALELAVDEAARAGCEAVGPRHLLAGLLRATPQVVAGRRSSPSGCSPRSAPRTARRASCAWASDRAAGRCPDGAPDGEGSAWKQYPVRGVPGG